MTEPSSEVKFDIGHVLFIDIVGYSSKNHPEQRQLFSFSAVSHCPLRIGSMISFARAFAAAMTFVRKER
jgi:hypothetical protein